MMSHYKQKHSSSVKTYPCHFCNQVFNWSSQLSNHLDAIHNVKKEFECGVCGRYFHHQSKAKIHVNNYHRGMDAIIRHHELPHLPPKVLRHGPSGRLIGGFKAHHITVYPATAAKKYPQRKCRVCQMKKGIRRDTRNYCQECNVALCKTSCFSEYHSKKVSLQPVPAAVNSSNTKRTWPITTDKNTVSRKNLSAVVADDIFIITLGLNTISTSITRQRMLKLSTTHYQNNSCDQEMVSCPVCGKYFKHRRSMTHHYKHKHASSKAISQNYQEGQDVIRSPLNVWSSKCSNEKNLIHRNELFNHFFKDYNRYEDNNSCDQQMVSCPVCGKDFRYKRGMVRHYKHKHDSSNIFRCHLCSQIFGLANQLSDHLDSIHNIKKEFECGLCGRSFHHFSRAKLHTNSYHPGTDVKIKHNSKLQIENFSYKAG
ncbi:Zinc finger protein 841 [Nymphon striatum]|nr:Zinc finger protein 841 [Nymphon striatum]